MYFRVLKTKTSKAVVNDLFENIYQHLHSIT